jgi:hypothetical protein
MHKWYFCGVDGPISWNTDRERAFRFSSREDAEGAAKALNSGRHLITPSDGGARLRFHNFRVEEASQNSFLICFDAEPESGLPKTLSGAIMPTQ